MATKAHITEAMGIVGKFPNIESLAEEHDRISREFDANYDNGDKSGKCEQLNNRMWAIRAQIAATPSRSQSELSAKVRIFQIEVARDPEFECDVAGSARDLSKSIAADVMTLQIAA